MLFLIDMPLVVGFRHFCSNQMFSAGKDCNKSLIRITNYWCFRNATPGMYSILSIPRHPNIYLLRRCFSHVFGVQIPSQEVFGCLGNNRIKYTNLINLVWNRRISATQENSAPSPLFQSYKWPVFPFYLKRPDSKSCPESPMFQYTWEDQPRTWIR